MQSQSKRPKEHQGWTAFPIVLHPHDYDAILHQRTQAKAVIGCKRVYQSLHHFEKRQQNYKKKRGMDLLKAKQKKIRNTHSENENEELLKSISNFIQNLICLDAHDINALTTKEIIKYRDNFMALICLETLPKA